MKTTLLLTAGLLTLICAVPASATPVLDAAQLVSQATINPIFMQYEGVDGSVDALDKAAKLIEETLAAPVTGQPPEPTDQERLRKVGQGDVILSGLLTKAMEGNTSEDRAGLKIVDGDGFAKSFMRMLNNKNPELTRFAAVGWDMSEKRAASKIASLAKKPNFDDTHAAIIAILIGMLKETEANTYYVGSANGGVWKAQQAAVDSGDYELWRANHGTGI